MTEAQRRYGRDEVEFARAVTFFDAIFAFALTLLVTTIDDFAPDAWASPRALWNANGSSLSSFAISFVVVVQFWMGSHRQLASFSHLDRRLISLQAGMMFGVVLIPFTTEAMGKTELQDLPLPVALYAANVGATYVMSVIVSLTADRNELRPERMSAAERRETLTVGMVLPVVFFASIPIAYLVSPNYGRISWVLVPLLIGPVQRWAKSRPDR